MARPRKDQGDCAEQRIKDAFWALLEQNDLKDITVSMITSKANCNRGTFYYHFNSLEELVDAIITDELFINSSVPRALFYLLCKKSNPFEQENFALHIKALTPKLKLPRLRCGKDFSAPMTKNSP